MLYRFPLLSEAFHNLKWQKSKKHLCLLTWKIIALSQTQKSTHSQCLFCSSPSKCLITSSFILSVTLLQALRLFWLLRTHHANGCTESVKIWHTCSQTQLRTRAWCWGAECDSQERSLAEPLCCRTDAEHGFCFSPFLVKAKILFGFLLVSKTAPSVGRL